MSKSECSGEARKLAIGDLARSGLGPKYLNGAFGIRALTSGQAKTFDPSCWWWGVERNGLPCLVFEYSDLDGRPTGMWRLRWLRPPTSPSKRDIPRYHQLSGTRPGIWFSRSQNWRELLTDPKARIVITEGEKKAEALCQAGFPAIGLGGVWSTGSRRLGIHVLPELLGIDWLGRPSLILFDSDTKPNTVAHVALATLRLAELLRSQGAEVRIANLPLLSEKEAAK